MDIFAAKSTKDVWHKGKTGNVYQLDSISSQLNVEKRLEDSGNPIKYVDSRGREKEAEELVTLVHQKNYLDVFRRKKEEPAFTSSGLMLQPSLYPVALQHALISKDIVDSALANKVSFTSIGGGHHCEKDKPLGFGLVNNMAISAVYATSLNQRVALIDLDTHYSNGCMDLLRQRENILMTSLWNQAIPAWKYYEK